MNILSTCCSRRDILKLTASTSLITVLSVFTSGCGRSLDSVARQMTGNLNHPEKAREIGNIYINNTLPGQLKGHCRLHSVRIEILKAQDALRR